MRRLAQATEKDRETAAAIVSQLLKHIEGQALEGKYSMRVVSHIITPLFKETPPLKTSVGNLVLANLRILGYTVTLESKDTHANLIIDW